MILHTSFNGPGGYFCSDLLSNSIWSTSTFYRIRRLLYFSCFAFLFLTLSSYFHLQNFSEDFGYYLSHWYHLSLSVSIIYHKIFHISISFLYKFTYIIFMQKGETQQYGKIPLTVPIKICYNRYVRRSLRERFLFCTRLKLPNI
jgi:hypothetical protein